MNKKNIYTLAIALFAVSVLALVFGGSHFSRDVLKFFWIIAYMIGLPLVLYLIIRLLKIEN